MNSSTLFLIPTTLGETDPLLYLPQSTLSAVKSLAHFIVEEERSARRLLSKLSISTPIQQCSFSSIGKHQSEVSTEELLAPLLAGNNVGLISEAGCPGVADPGQKVIATAQAKGIHVVPLVGPCSILLALMASGANGQKFTFNGYLPVEKDAREKTLQQLEKEAAKGCSQIFIEVPHRNQQMIESLLSTCSSSTLLTIASNITLADEFIATRTIANWKQSTPELKKIPAVFILPAVPIT